MPRVCSIVSCPGVGGHLFSFPKDAAQCQRWIEATKGMLKEDRTNAAKTKFICAGHFKESEIKIYDAIGEGTEVRFHVERRKWGLSLNATPTLFPAQALRKEVTIMQSIIPPTIECFSSLTDILNKKDIFAQNNWSVMEDETAVHLFKVKISGCPFVWRTIKIGPTFDVEIFYEKTKISCTIFEKILGRKLKCDSFSKLSLLIQDLEGFEIDSATDFEHFKLNKNIAELSEIIEEEYCNDENRAKLEFFRDQMILFTLKRPQYSCITMTFAAMVYFTFPAAYLYIRDYNVLTLPGPTFLKAISKPDVHIGVLEECLKRRFTELHFKDKYINILIDEIYVKPQASYKGNKIQGFAVNSSSVTLASTVQVFMLTSHLSRTKEVIGIFPAKKLTATDLHTYALTVMQVLNNLNFEIVSIVSDNNRVNVNLFKLLSGNNTVQPFIISPFDSNKNIFFMFDTVHLLKSIRNNWINSIPKMFCFPSFNGDDEIFTARFNDLILVYNKEKNSTVKLAPSLSLKSLYPTSFERQSVPLALSIFDEKTIEAVRIFENRLGQESEGTVEFLSIIRKWWIIVNCKHPGRGHRIREPLALPVSSTDQDNIKYLKQFSSWLKSWDNSTSVESLSRFKGKLTTQTMAAISLTTTSLILVSEYLLSQCNFSFVLLGKFQTDPLELRFSQYRQMSGSNYNISVQQILESEKKIKITSFLKLHSSQKGIINLRDINVNVDDGNRKETLYDTEIVDGIIDNSFNVDISVDCKNSLIYVAGYVARKIIAANKCQICYAIFNSDKDMEIDADENFSYMSNLNRGGLKYPSEVTISMSYMSYQIFQTVISNEFESYFLQQLDQKSFIMHLINKKLEFYDCEACEICSTKWSTCLQKFSSTWANIFLKNYCKEKSDIFIRSQKRKLATLN